MWCLAAGKPSKGTGRHAVSGYFTLRRDQACPASIKDCEVWMPERTCGGACKGCAQSSTWPGHVPVLGEGRVSRGGRQRPTTWGLLCPSSQASLQMSFKRPIAPKNEWKMLDMDVFDSRKGVPSLSPDSEGGDQRPTVGEPSGEAAGSVALCQIFIWNEDLPGS